MMHVMGIITKKVNKYCPSGRQKHMASLRRQYVVRSLFCMFMLLFLYGCAQGSVFGEMVKHVAKSVRHTDSVKPTPTTHPVIASPTATPVDQPARLVIPAIHLDAAVETVGLQASGDLDTPQEHPLDDVGWYSMGPQPGAVGSAVIDGHLDRPGGAPAVFWYLNDLQIGDDVMVLSSDGKTLHFRVTRVQAYPPNAAPLQAIFGDMSGNYLNLITCAGYWIPSEHQTTQRLVVYTSLVQ